MNLIHKTFQLRAYTGKPGHDRLDEVLRNCAHLYNSALEEWRAAYRHKGHDLSVSRTKFDQMKEQTWGILRNQLRYKAVSVFDVKVFQLRKWMYVHTVRSTVFPAAPRRSGAAASFS